MQMPAARLRPGRARSRDPRDAGGHRVFFRRGCWARCGERGNAERGARRAPRLAAAAEHGESLPGARPALWAAVRTALQSCPAASGGFFPFLRMEWGRDFSSGSVSFVGQGGSLRGFQNSCLSFAKFFLLLRFRLALTSLWRLAPSLPLAVREGFLILFLRHSGTHLSLWATFDIGELIFQLRLGNKSP